jgi:cytochrome c oxidase cbb3-type subunit 3
MNKIKNIKTLAISMLLPVVGFCQEQTVKETSSYFSNVLFITLLSTIVLLAVVMVAFASVFKNIADSDFLANKYGNKPENNSSAIKSVITFLLICTSASMIAQEKVLATVIKDDGRIGGLDQFTFYFMVFVIFIELLILGLMFFQFNFLVKTQIPITEKKSKIVESKLLMSLTDAVPIEEEESILLDHDYDGIKELDNNLPPWWKYGFYFTIVVAIIYLFNFHVLKTGALQGQEYINEIAQARLEVDEFMKNSANNVDENTVKLLTEDLDMVAGKDVFMANCSACHGKLGEGTVGPNFADEYWIHGGGVKDIFKTIKYGWVEKGMKAWKEDLSPMQMAQVTSYIKSLRGSNPPNGKVPQGDLFVEGGETSSTDFKSVANDSLKFQIKSDSINAALNKTAASNK